MWRRGIHSFLELLRHKLPESLDHMLSFIYLAYGMIALLLETVEAFKNTWMECLGDLARYRMAIEEKDEEVRGIWMSVSREWYSRASDNTPDVGRLYHHLSSVVRPNALQELFYYTKSLCVSKPFPTTRQSIMRLFDLVLTSNPSRLSRVDMAFIRFHDILFSGRSRDQLETAKDEFLSRLDNDTKGKEEDWIEKG